jgi:hypothetical protein
MDPVARASEPVWQVAKIDFHIRFRFLVLLKPFKLFASTKIQAVKIEVDHKRFRACMRTLEFLWVVALATTEDPKYGCGFSR